MLPVPFRKRLMAFLFSAPVVVGGGMALIVFGGLMGAHWCVHINHSALKITESDWLDTPVSIAADTLPPVSRYPVQMLAQAPAGNEVEKPFQPVPVEDFTPRRDPFAPLVPPIVLPQTPDGRAKVVAPGDSASHRLKKTF